MKKFMASIILLSSITLTSSAFAATQSWSDFVKNLRHDAIAEGIKPQLFDRLFQHIRPKKRILNLDRRQPEKRLTYLKYRNTRGDNYRIHLGRKRYQRYNQLLTQIGNDYGVSPCVIVSLWGIESSYGNFMGHHPVINALATLAYDSRRSSFFRKELLYALHILNEGHIDPKDFKGEWAGGSGQPQFLPSSWHNYAVDHNGDGKKDIWRTKADVFASIANYLSQHGWQQGGLKNIQVELPEHFDKSLVSLKITKPVKEWKAMGVRLTHPSASLNPNTPASLIDPYGGPAYLVFNNFKVIMKYNRSTFYAGTVSYMADKICRR